MGFIFFIEVYNLITFYLLLVLLIIPTIWFFYGNKTAQKIKLNNGKLHSLIHYYGLFVLLYSLLPSIFVYIIILIGDDILFSYLINDYIPENIKNSSDYNLSLIHI